MKWYELGKNLKEYRDSSLEVVNFDNVNYLTKTDYNPSAILVQCFGRRADFESYNFKLANSIVAAKHFFGKDLEVIAQEQVSRICNEHSFNIPHETVCQDWLEKNYYPRTDLVLGQSREMLDKNNLDPENVIYTCHPAHLYRVMEMGKKVGLKGIPFIRENVEWQNSKGDEFWIHSPWRWIPREFAARVKLKLDGKL